MFNNQIGLWIRSLVKTFAKVQKVYPTLTNAVQLIASASAWTLGSNIQVVPPNTITSRFRIDYVSFASFSAATSYEVAFYKGASGSEIEIGRVRVHPGVTTGTAICVPIFTELLDANTRISAKSATSTVVADTVIVSIVYHLDEA